MKQLTQQLKSGKMEILEVPFPALPKGYILVRNYFSVISSGTEGKTVSDARKGYFAKAKSRKNEVAQVVKMIKANGILPTYKFVMNKLEMPSSLGYSASGEVIGIGEGVTNFRVGDKVACGGNNAVHADVISVPVNLCVKLPENVDLEQGAFVSLAAIAIQGIRQSEVTFGENCVVIGMGVIGQLTYKILESFGVYPLGIEIDDKQIKLAKSAGIREIFNRNTPGIEEIISKHTNGNGPDSVIITASGNSNDPVEFAGEIARKKAKIIIVGNVPTGFSRKSYYRKELDLRMSSSYGPGRYDDNYEELGNDYPIGHVRWTENRNMKSFIDSLASSNLNISKLITHRFSLNDASDAYDMILKKEEPYSGILLKYDIEANIQRKVVLTDKKNTISGVNVGFIGAGSFAQGTLLPKMKDKCNFIGIANSRGNSARYVADKYNFSYCAENSSDLFNDENINTIFICTRHNLHKDLVVEALKNGKNVFVEKPLALTKSGLFEIRDLYDSLESKPVILVGFNRRFSPAIIKIKELFNKDIPKSISIRVNAGKLPSDHWVNDINIGGGRIIGEAVHFIDLAMHLADGEIISVSANSMKDPDGLNNSVSIILEFDNGNIASINYFSNGNSSLPKEQIEVFGGGLSAVINDFKSMVIYNKGIKKIKFKGQDKGHENEIDSFFLSLRENKDCEITFEEIFISTLSSFLVNKSIIENRKIFISDEI